MVKVLDKKIERKIRKVGNSLSVTIPKEVLDFADLKEGDTIEFVSKEGDLLIKKHDSIVTPEFMQMIEEICEEQKEVLSALVDR